jgi:hypothetical protein
MTVTVKITGSTQTDSTLFSVFGQICGSEEWYLLDSNVSIDTLTGTTGYVKVITDINEYVRTIKVVATNGVACNTTYTVGVVPNLPKMEAEILAVTNSAAPSADDYQNYPPRINDVKVFTRFSSDFCYPNTEMKLEMASEDTPGNWDEIGSYGTLPRLTQTSFSSFGFSQITRSGEHIFRAKSDNNLGIPDYSDDIVVEIKKIEDIFRFSENSVLEAELSGQNKTIYYDTREILPFYEGSTGSTIDNDYPFATKFYSGETENILIERTEIDPVYNFVKMVSGGPNLWYVYGYGTEYGSGEPVVLYKGVCETGGYPGNQDNSRVIVGEIPYQVFIGTDSDEENQADYCTVNTKVIEGPSQWNYGSIYTRDIIDYQAGTSEEKVYSNQTYTSYAQEGYYGVGNESGVEKIYYVNTTGDYIEAQYFSCL